MHSVCAQTADELRRLFVIQPRRFTATLAQDRPAFFSKFAHAGKCLEQESGLHNIGASVKEGGAERQTAPLPAQWMCSTTAARLVAEARAGVIFQTSQIEKTSEVN